jgi:hypothetical protein
MTRLSEQENIRHKVRIHDPAELDPAMPNVSVPNNSFPAEPAMNTTTTPPQPFADRLAEYPALAQLRLTAGDMDELSRQGFLSLEQRGNRTNHKLRFRRGGRQVVRYIGDAAEAAAVKQELDQLQSRRRIRRDLAALDRAARRLLRQTKTRLEPLVTAYGWKYHGRVVRRPHPVN